MSDLTKQLRPAGRGIPLQSTGGSEIDRLEREFYGSPEKAQVEWKKTLEQVIGAKAGDSPIVVLGIPSDVGAGIHRGAAWGPVGIRRAYLQLEKAYPEGVWDLGDIFCIPQLLHDDMLSQQQRTDCQQALYGKSGQALPVSPLSLLESVLGSIRRAVPESRVVLLGGDHSVSWPMMIDCQAQMKQGDKKIGTLHFDAHTDLLESRQGIRYCFATWAAHASKILPEQAIVQVGVRTSGQSQSHWESQYPLKQVWAETVLKDESKAIDAILAHFQSHGFTHLYVTNDIDGTDVGAAPATGTPESGGLSPEFVQKLITKLSQQLTVIGGDIVEVAPPLGATDDYAQEKTCVLAANYLKCLLKAMQTSHQ